MLDSSKLYEDILEHAIGESPNESCGVVIVHKGKERYVPCRNIADKPEQGFFISPEDYANAEDLGEIIKIVHSHPKKAPKPSQPDLVNIEKMGMPWIIISPITGQTTETNPSGYQAPLVGREYSWGTLDCFTLIRDYYKEILDIDMVVVPEYKSEERWFENNKNYILDLYEKNGFQKVDSPQKHDLVVMTCNSKVPNHLGVYLGNGDFLHHRYGRLSSRDVYGNAGYWQQSTWGFLRHTSLF